MKPVPSQAVLSNCCNPPVEKDLSYAQRGNAALRLCGRCLVDVDDRFGLCEDNEFQLGQTRLASGELSRFKERKERIDMKKGFKDELDLVEAGLQ